jgi:hypothetical protein
MSINYQTTLSVNTKAVPLNEFAHGYVTQIVLCAVSMFKGGENVKDLHYTINGKKTELIINDHPIVLGHFTHDALFGTVTGMVSSLRDVNKVDTLKLDIKAV